MNVLIIDDHELIREGLAMMVRQVRPHAGIWVAESIAPGMEIAERENIDFTFLDLHFADASGFQALEQMKQRHEYMSVVVISAKDDRETVIRALETGAKAFIPKSASSLQMAATLQDLFNGKVCISQNILAENELGHGAWQRAVAKDDWTLTDRQKEVLALLVNGMSNKMIARKLDIAESTVKIHVSAVFREMKVATRTQALLEVARRGTQLPLHRFQ